MQLGKLTFLWDDNHITDDGDTELSISEDVPARFRAASWHVEEVNGHDIEAISSAMDAAKADPRPSMIACRTIIARGIPRLQGQRGGHSAPLLPSDATEARETLGWDHPPFHVPETVRADWDAAMARGAEALSAWQTRLMAHPEQAEFDRWITGTLPADWSDVVQKITSAQAADSTARPTITSSGDTCDALAAPVPETMVLCADLEAPTNHKRHRHAFTARDRSGSYVHCGVREHLMGAMCNGIAAHGGLRAVNVTYLAFADYERPAMRMAAVMGLPALFVFSHDSIGVGSNGPTHQPVEILASFRAMPNMRVFRPADAVETAEAWDIALRTTDGPSLFALSKQPAEQGHRMPGENLSARGAYVLQEADGPRDVTLLATGTEVGLALQARAALAEQESPPPWSPCPAGNSSRRRHGTIAMPYWAMGLGLASRPRCSSAGNDGCGPRIPSSA